MKDEDIRKYKQDMMMEEAIASAELADKKTLEEIKEVERSKDQIVLTMKDEDIIKEFREFRLKNKEFVELLRKLPYFFEGITLREDHSNIENFYLEKVKEAEDRGYADAVKLYEKKMVRIIEAFEEKYNLLEERVKNIEPKIKRELIEKIKEIHTKHYMKWIPTEEQKGYRKAQMDILTLIGE